MTLVVLFILDMLNELSVPWWVYVLCVMGAPLEAVIGAVIIENT